MKRYNRRQFLGMAGQTAVVLGGTYLVQCVSNPGASRREPVTDGDPSAVAAAFPQGIGSGDPRPDGVLLWTRAPSEGSTPVEFRIARDSALTDVISEGLVGASSEDDWTVRLRLRELEPGTTYYYRFFVGGVPSALGRTRTAPGFDEEVDVRFAITSCQDYLGRYYHAWRALAEADDVDFVLFLGDYVYEYTQFPGLLIPTEERKMVLPDGLVIDEANGVIAAESLEDYRELYRTIRSDPNLQEAHRMFPFVLAWDDHEFANDAWQDHAVDFSEARGDEQSTARREAATRAWFEHLPVDVPYDAQAGFPDDIQTYRELRWGSRLAIFLTDQRYYRDDHVIPEGPLDPVVGKAVANSPLGSRILAKKGPFNIREAEASPTMLGQDQLAWFTDSVLASDAQWKVFASALMVAEMAMDLSEFPGIPLVFQDTFYFKLDHWDGYRSERARLLEEFRGVENFLVLSGDLHGFYASELRPDFDSDEPATAVELTVGGITSISLGEQIDVVVQTQPLLSASGLGEVVQRLDETFLASNPHYRYSNSFGYGLGVADVNSERIQVEFRFIADPRDPEYRGVSGTELFEIPAGKSELKRLTPG